VIQTSQPFFLPEKPPEGESSLVEEIRDHLKKRPPAHEREKVIPEDHTIKDAKEQ
jgi:hypothetical protein